MSKEFLHSYFKKWMKLYKQDFVQPVTYQKYVNAHFHLRLLAPKLRLSHLTRVSYQELLNLYAETHERLTVMDFHHLVKAAILDAKDEGLVSGDLVRKAVIKERKPIRHKRVKFLNCLELENLLSNLILKNEVSWDYFIYLLAKTGLRFSEARALTPKDFDFEQNLLKINKTWNYKNKEGGFQGTKNKSSIRVIKIDKQTSKSFLKLTKGIEENQLIFVKKRVFNSVVNGRLYKLCRQSNIPEISLHGLRHTHASLLLYAEVSVASVSRRLGHSNTAITQEIYLHIVKELEEKDEQKISSFLETI
ncbi:MAG: site-specific integrase [Lactovum sp.]